MARLFTWQDEADLTNWTTVNLNATVESSPPTDMGTSCLKFPGTATADWVRKNYAGRNRGSLWARAYVCFSVFDGYNEWGNLLDLYGSSYGPSIQVNTASTVRRFRLSNPNDSTSATMTAQLTAGVVYRIELGVGISLTAGTLEMRVYEGESETALETVTMPGNGTLNTMSVTGTYSYLRVGNASAKQLNAHPFYVNWIACNNNLGYIQNTWIGSSKDIPSEDAEPMPEGQDIYGGYLSLPVPGGATGHFRVAKLGNRWVFATPLGNAFWMRGVYYVVADTSHTSYSYSAPLAENCDAHETTECPQTHGATVTALYGDTDLIYAPAQLRRIRRWGFNAIAEGASPSAKPWSDTAAVKMPGIPFYIAGAYYPRYNTPSSAGVRFLPDGGNIKDVGFYGSGIHYSGYGSITDIGQMVDVYDPGWRDWIDARLASSEFVGYMASPYTLGWSFDDTDWLRGWGGGTDFASSPTPGKYHPHIGWIIAAGVPYQACVPDFGERYYSRGEKYTDPTTFSKIAWRDFLIARYGSGAAGLNALNAAWNTGGYYTTWDSAATQITGEACATGDGTTLTFDFTLAQIPQERSLCLYVNGVPLAGDIHGGVRGARISTASTISYTTGAVHLVFAAYSDTTGDTTLGSNEISGLANVDNLRVGDRVYVSSGFATTGPFTITERYISSLLNKITVNATATSTQANVTVSLAAPLNGDAITVDYRYGGWSNTSGAPQGDGLLDESGLHAWFGAYSHSLANTNATLAADLNDFLREFTRTYYRTYHDALVAAGYHSHVEGQPSKPILGPTALGTWGTPARREMYQAAADYVDVIRTGVDLNAADVENRIAFIEEHVGGKPLYMGVYLTANPDSMFFLHQRPADFDNVDKDHQEEKGAMYADRIALMLALEKDGDKIGIGVSWWQYTDNYLEFANFGLVSLRDNAYDGHEATIAGSVDTWSLPGETIQRGGEVADYGDCITAVMAANASVESSLRLDALGGAELRLSVR